MIDFNPRDEAQRRTGRFREMAREERDRVRGIIQRDKDYHSAEIIRAAAEIEFTEGKPIAIVDAVLPPTPEWIAKGDVGHFTPRLEDGTVKTVKGYRRQITPIVARMHAAGKLTDAQFQACTWYAALHAIAGLEGRVKTSNFSLAGNVGGGGGMGQAPMALHEFEAQARHLFRAARKAMTDFYLVYFDKIVLDGIPVSRSWRFSRAPKHKAESRFRSIAQELAEFRDRLDDHSKQFGADTRAD
jgi:hypothetical protein